MKIVFTRNVFEFKEGEIVEAEYSYYYDRYIVAAKEIGDIVCYHINPAHAYTLHW